MSTFRWEFQTHESLLTQKFISLKERFSENSVDTNGPKLGLIDGAGTIYNASDEEFYTKSINILK